MSPNMSLRELQRIIAETYLERDRERGVEKTLLWMISEAGEVVDAYLKRDSGQIRGEVSDLLAWLLSFCNLVGVDLEEVFLERYGRGCPRCGLRPCACPPK